MENKTPWGQHWGTIASETTNIQIPDVSADIEFAMNKCFLSDLEDEDYLIPKTEDIKIFPLNSLISYGIKLHKYKNNMLDLIEKASSSRNLTQEEIDETVLDLPEPFENQTSKTTSSSMNYTSTDFTDFTMGKEVEVPILNRTIINLILRKSVATIFAHIGYETGEQTALNVLADVLEDFLKLICDRYNVATEDKETRNYDGFPHTIERVLTEVGMNGIKGIDDFYQARVIKYSKTLYNRCKDLHEDYRTMSIPRTSPPSIRTVKIEKEDVSEMENPEVHFPLIDGDVKFSILETGYQLLSSLEAAETNLQSLADSVEDMAASEPAPVIQISQEENISHLSPFNKKPRYM